MHHVGWSREAGQGLVRVRVRVRVKVRVRVRDRDRFEIRVREAGQGLERRDQSAPVKSYV